MRLALLHHFHQQLQRWYRRHGRHDLPWRKTPDAYAIYISEIMLQQTQVETVRARYYAPFLKRFPTLSALAKASEKDVLSAWQGLGYYNRALNVQKAARQCKGTLPDTAEGLMALPGVGRNTANAVLAFAHHQPVPVMEANVKRVLCRVFALKNPAEPVLWEKAEMLLNRASPFDYNQAMMDLGSMLCTKRAPRCGECPAAEMCQGKKSPHLYPAAKKKKSVPVRKRHILLKVDRHGHILATKRRTRFLQGMYHFCEQEDPPSTQAKKIGDVKQIYSHFTLEAAVYIVRIRGEHKKDAYSLAQLRKLPMSMAEKKILQLLLQRGTFQP